MSFTKLQGKDLQLVSDGVIDFYPIRSTSTNGPFAHGEWRFGAFVNFSVRPYALRVMGSIHGLEPWLPLDTANDPTVHDHFFHGTQDTEVDAMISAIQDGEVMLIAHANEAGNLEIARFDMENRVWMEPITGGPSLKFKPENIIGMNIHLLRRSDGSLVLVHPTPYAAYMTYNGSWSGSMPIGTWNPHSAVVDAQDRVHVFGYDPFVGSSITYPLRVATIQADGEIYSQSVDAQGVSVNETVVTPAVGSTGEILLPYPRAVMTDPPPIIDTLWGHITALSATAADQPSFAPQEVSSLHGVYNAGPWNEMRFAAVEQEGQMCVLWIHPGDLPVSLFATTRLNGEWQPDVRLYNTVQDRKTPDRGYITGLMARAYEDGTMGLFMRIRRSTSAQWAIFYMETTSVKVTKPPVISTIRNYVY